LPDIQILALLDEPPFLSAYSIADAPGVPFNNVKLFVGIACYRISSLTLDSAPGILSLQGVWEEICQDLLSILETNKKIQFEGLLLVMKVGSL
jgi:hypothetical protein